MGHGLCEINGACVSPVITQAVGVLTAPAQREDGGRACACPRRAAGGVRPPAVGGCCLPRCVRIQRGACICGCYDWSHAPVLFAARRTGNRPVILILHYNRCRRIVDSSTKDLSIRQISLYIILFILPVIKFVNLTYCCLPIRSRS